MSGEAWRPDATTIRAIIQDLLNEAVFYAPVGLPDPNEISHEDRVYAEAYRKYAERLRARVALATAGEADESTVNLVARIIAPKVDEVRNHCVSGHDRSEVQIARLVLSALAEQSKP